MPAQLVHDCCGLAFEAVQDVAIFTRRGVWYRYAVSGQVLHQVQVKRQLLKRQALKQRQHVFAAFGIDKIIGVLDAA